MTVNVSKPAKSIRAGLAQLAGLARQKTVITIDHEFDGSDPSVVLAIGQKPLRVYLNGSRQREGELNDYTVSFDGFRYTVTWVVTPSNVSAAIIDVEVG